MAIADAAGDRLYDQALRLRRTLVGDIEADETRADGKPGMRTASALGTLSWGALEARDFALALASIERAIDLEPDQLWLKTNRAHALMMLGRLDEASGLYIAYRDEHIYTDGDTTTWRRAVLDDLRLLQLAGLSSPLMAKVQAALHGS